MKKVIALMLLPIYIAFAQVNLHKSNANALGADAYITTPIHHSIGKIHAFVLVLLFIVGLVATYKIYHRWQLGEEDVLPLIYRWWSGIIVSFFILQFLRNYLSHQSFGEYQPITF